MRLLSILCIFLPCIIFANEIKLICENNGKLFNNNLNKRFSKIINFKNQTIENISGHSFDKLLVFNKYEVVMYNYIFDYSSSYNISTSVWTIYDKNFVDFYDCKKRR